MLQNSKQLFARITRQWPVKVLSVAAAIILFMFHRMEDMQQRFFSAPLRLEINGNLVPSNPYPRAIKVTLRGDANSVYPVADSDIEVFLDLTEYEEPGHYKVPVQVRKKGTAMEAESLEIDLDPAEIRIDLDTRTSKSVPVIPNFQGSPENGYELVTYVLEPDQMIVDGPMNLVSSVVELATEPVDLRNVNADVVLRLKTVSPNSLLTIRGDGMTEFRGYIGESIMIRSFDNLPLTGTGLPGAWSAVFEPAVGNVRLEGAQRTMESFEPPEHFLSVDLSGVTGEGVYVLPVTAALPEDFLLRDQDPLEATVRIIPFVPGTSP
jgi:hypothetical protein